MRIPKSAFWAILLLFFIDKNGGSVDGYKILVVSPTVSRSHMIENGRVADALQQDGHNVTLLELDWIVELGSVKSVHFAKYWPVTHESAMRKRQLDMDFGSQGIITETKNMYNFLSYANKLQFELLDKKKELIEELRAQKFDAIFYEQFVWGPLVLAELLDIKVRVMMSSCPLVDNQAAVVGVPFQHSYVPIAFNAPFTDKMSIFERLHNTVQGHLMVALFYYDYTYRVHPGLVARYGSSFPSPWEIAKTADLSVINTDEFIDYPRPLPPNVIHIGGLGMEHHFSMELASPYKEIMKKGEKGIVFFSFGSILPTEILPNEYMNNLISAFEKQQDYYFIMKLSKNDEYGRNLAKKAKNIYVADWAPQPQILAHPRLRLFITHGGYNSIMEAATSAAPILAMGMFADQPRNAKVVERNGWGLSLDKFGPQKTPALFEAKLQELLANKKFKINALRIQKILKTKPQNGEQRLLSYVKFLEQNDGHLPEIQSIAPHMGIIEYNNLDVYFYILSALIIVITTTFYVIRLIGKTLYGLILTPKAKLD